MDHAYIEDADIVSRYALHRLSPEEKRAFEEHFVDCPDCLDRLESTKKLRQGLAALATDAGVGTTRARTPRLLALAAAIVLCAGLAGAVVQIVGLRRELASVRQDRSEIDARTHELARRADDLQRRLDERRPQAGTPAPAGHEPENALAGVPVIALSIVRGGSIGATPAVQVRLPAQAHLIVLLLDIGAVSFPAYRATLTTSDGTTLWTVDRLVPATPTELAVTVPSDPLRPGDYLVYLAGRDRDGRLVSVGHYAFRVSGGSTK
jgi:hypothetical protein